MGDNVRGLTICLHQTKITLQSTDDDGIKRSRSLENEHHARVFTSSFRCYAVDASAAIGDWGAVAKLHEQIPRSQRKVIRSSQVVLCCVFSVFLNESRKKITRIGLARGQFVIF